MPQQKITDWEPVIDDWEPINDWEPVQEEYEPSLLEKYEQSWINQPLSRHIKSNGQQLFDPKYAADYYDPRNADPTKQARIPDWIPFVGGGTWRSLGAGALEGAGGVVEGFTSPLNLATTGAFTGAGALTKIAPKAASALNTAGRVMSAPVALTGAQKVLDEDRPIGERLFGVAEMAGGMAGIGQKLPQIKPGVGSKPIPEPTIDFEQAPIQTPKTKVQDNAIPEFGPTVTLKSPTPAKVAELRQKGYISAGVDENGFPQMVHKGLLDRVEKATQPSLFGPDEIHFDEEIKIKNPSARAIKQLQDQGFELVHVDENGNEAIFRPIREEEMRVPNSDAEIPNEFLPDYPHQEKRIQDVGPPEGMMDRRLPERYDDPTLMGKMRPSDKLIPDARQNQLLDILGGKQFDEAVPPDWMPQEARIPERTNQNPRWIEAEADAKKLGIDPRNFDNIDDLEWAITQKVAQETHRTGINPLITPEDIMHMKVPNKREGTGGLNNVAVGGADPRVLDVLGSSLYSKPRSVVTMKELLQNAIDEHRISGSKSPIRVLTRDNVKNPLTGEMNNAITVRDRGRGLKPEEIYTVLTDVGKTGKAGIDSASGGFGFAKAAPFLGGKYVQVHSVIKNEAGQKIRLTFEGDPAALKNQARGVPLNRTVVPDSTPTGLEVTTYFPTEAPIYSANEMAKNMAQLAKKGGPELWMADVSGKDIDVDFPELSGRSWLDSMSDDPDFPSNRVLGYYHKYKGEGLPELQGNVETPGAKIDIRYAKPTAGREASGYDLHFMNKGLYQGSEYKYYANEPVPNVPTTIVADISAIVEEGQEGYPFAANREAVDRSVTQAIDKWVDDNIKSGAVRARVQSIQKNYDNIQTMPNGRTLFYDKNGTLTPTELELISTHPEWQRGIDAIEAVQKELLAFADTLGWQRIAGKQEPGWVPSQRLKKFGVLFQGPDANGTTLGIHIPRPDDLNDSAILINVMELLKRSMTRTDTLNQLSTALYTTLTHEIAHVPGGGHDTSFAYRHADMLEKLGRTDTIKLLNQLKGAFDDGSGNISPEISDLLSIYTESRGRKGRKDDALLATGTSSIGRPDSNRGTGENVESPRASENEPSPLTEAYNFSRGMLASWDLSAPLRQGMGLAFTKEWRDAIGPMLKSLGPESAYKEVVRSIEQKPLFQRRVNTQTGKIMPSYAESVGLKITDLRKSLSNREEATMSNWAEKYVPGVGRSNRAYNAFLNKLRADTFERLMNEARDSAGGDAGLNPYRNEKFARELAEYVMTATGRGPLKMATPTLIRTPEGQYRPAWKERSFEQAADILTHGFFSPKLITSRMRMLNPGTYIMASPFVRQQYLKSAMITAGMWSGLASLAALAGADVSTDLNSADFGKIKVGNTRIDPGAGFQQYLVAFNRLLSGKTTSSATGEETILGEGFQAETGKDIGERFITNKLHPVLKFAYDLWDASEYKPFNMGDRLLQMFVPLIVQDIYELATGNPELLPLIAPIGLGMGAQTYEAGETQGKMIPPEMDYQITGSPTKPMYDWFTGQ